MRFRECNKNEQAWLVFGGLLVALGLVLLLSGYTAWWMRLLAWLRRASRIIIPGALIIVAIYAVWASRTDKPGAPFKSVRMPTPSAQSLTRSLDDARVAGVCGGIAQYFGIESSIVRVIAVLLLFASPLLTFITYGILALVLPKP